MFTHPETESRDQVAVAEVVASALRFLSNECKDKVQIDQRFAPNIRHLGEQEQIDPPGHEPAAKFA